MILIVDVDQVGAHICIYVFEESVFTIEAIYRPIYLCSMREDFA